MVILSRRNPLVKELVSLKEKKGRRERGTFLVEGVKMVREAVGAGLEVVRLIVREDYAGETYSLPAVTLGADVFAACRIRPTWARSSERQSRRGMGNCILPAAPIRSRPRACAQA